MAEPTSSAAVLTVTSAGLTVFGMATGLHPTILLAGLAGGWWVLSYQTPAPLIKRVTAAALSAVIAGYLTPAITAGVTSLQGWPQAVTRDMVQFPIAVVIGLLALRVIGPAILRVAAKKAEEAVK